MRQSSRQHFSAGQNAVALFLSMVLVALIVSCNDSGTSPYAPSISYKRASVSIVVGNLMTPDTVVSDSGFVTGYSVSPALPAGLVLNAESGLISGTPTATSSSTVYTVTATGPGGSSKAKVTIRVFIPPPKALYDKGQSRFEGICSGCHGMDGEGSQPEVHPGFGNIPPLANSDFLMSDRHRPIRIQLLGLPNPIDTASTIIVKGDTYQASMPTIGGNDSDIAAVLSYVRAAFNNADDFITVQEVGQVRDSLVIHRPDLGVDSAH